MDIDYYSFRDCHQANQVACSVHCTICSLVRYQAMIPDLRGKEGSAFVMDSRRHAAPAGWL